MLQPRADLLSAAHFHLRTCASSARADGDLFQEAARVSLFLIKRDETTIAIDGRRVKHEAAPLGVYAARVIFAGLPTLPVVDDGLVEKRRLGGRVFAELAGF